MEIPYGKVIQINSPILKTENLRVILFGATGMAGSGVLDECLVHPAIEMVIAVSRKSTGVIHPKLKEVIHSDFKNYSSIETQLSGCDACFYCLGISQTQIKSETEYHEITYEYTMAAAETLCRLNPGMVFCFLSGAGTDPGMTSRMMWARIKGKAENDLKKFPFGKLFIFRPALIHQAGRVKSRLWMARILEPFYPVLNFLFPAFVTTTREFGRAMISAAIGLSEKNILENKDIRTLGK